MGLTTSNFTDEANGAAFVVRLYNFRPVPLT